MTQTAVDEIPLGPKLDAIAADEVFGSKNVHKNDGPLVGSRV